MSTTWANFWLDPSAVGTLVAAISGIGIAIGLEARRTLLANRERKLQAGVIFTVLIPPLGELSAWAERALNDPRRNNPQVFIQAIATGDPTFVRDTPSLIVEVFDRLHVLPPPVASKLSKLYSDLQGWKELCDAIQNSVGVTDATARTMPEIFRWIDSGITEVVREARKAQLPVQGLEDIQ